MNAGERGAGGRSSDREPQGSTAETGLDDVDRCAICGATTADDDEPDPTGPIRETALDEDGIVTVPACRFCRVNERALRETVPCTCLVCGEPAEHYVELEASVGVDDTPSRLAGRLCDEHAADVRHRLKRWAFNQLPEADHVYAVGIDLEDTDVDVDVTERELTAAAARDDRDRPASATATDGGERRRSE